MADMSDAANVVVVVVGLTTIAYLGYLAVDVTANQVDAARNELLSLEAAPMTEPREVQWQGEIYVATPVASVRDDPRALEVDGPGTMRITANTTASVHLVLQVVDGSGQAVGNATGNPAVLVLAIPPGPDRWTVHVTSPGPATNVRYDASATWGA